MRWHQLLRIFVFSYALGASPRLMAQPLQETSDTYDRLFSHDRKYQPRPEPIVTFEVGAHLGSFIDAGANLDDGARYRVLASSRLAYFLGAGVGITGGLKSQPETLLLASFWFVDVNDYALYLPLGFQAGDFYTGPGASIPVGMQANLQIEGNYYFDEKRWLVTAGFTYRLL